MKPSEDQKGEAIERQESPSKTVSGRAELRVDDRALRLLNRELPPGYSDQWAKRYSEAPQEEEQERTAVVIFRIGSEWFGLPAKVFREFAPSGPMHKIPHRSTDVLLGLTSIRSELHLAVSLHKLLGVGTAEEQRSSGGKRTFRRMALLQMGEETFVAPVDEVFGLVDVSEAEMERVPVNVEKAPATHTRGLFRHGDRRVSLLDHDLLIFDLRRHLE